MNLTLVVLQQASVEDRISTNQKRQRQLLEFV